MTVHAQTLELKPPAVVVHGGAGRAAADRRSVRRRGCAGAVRVAWACLGAGGSALDAVEAAVAVLEADPVFNAGRRGGVANCDGVIELDASIMEGATRRAGAVAGVQGVDAPVRLARAIMEDGRHVLLVGEGAAAFARARGFTLELGGPEGPDAPEVSAGDTVGAVALDALGGLAVATSTGGLRGQLPGRVGDSALIGCGTFADGYAAVSCTGSGEAIIRSVLARGVAATIAAGADPGGAAVSGLEEVMALTGGEAGLIALGSAGRAAWARTAPEMPVAWVAGDAAGPETAD